MPERRAILPRAGNPVRPVILLLAVAFGLLVIGLPVGMYLANFGISSIIFATVIILAITIRILGFAYRLAHAHDNDNEKLAYSEIWATWTISSNQYRNFVAGERSKTNRRALLCAAVGIILGITVGVLQEDALLAAMLIIGFLFAAAIIFTMAGPPKGSNADRLVRVGPRGMHFLGRYLPLDTPLTSSRRVRIVPGDPPVLRFTVKSGRRRRAVRVPVPPDRLDDAEALIDRFQRVHDPQPELDQPQLAP